jgi:hypothetical protein
VENTSNATACERLAAAPWDVRRRVAGVNLDDLKVVDAINSCESEHNANPHDDSISFLFGRTLLDSPNRFEESLKALRLATVDGYPGGWNEFAYLADKEKLNDLAGELYYGSFQRVVVDAFPILYPKMQSMPLTDRRQDALHQFTVWASQFGSVPAHLALAKSAESESEQMFHNLAAKKLAGQPIDGDLRKLNDPMLHSLVENELKLVNAETALYTLPNDLVDRLVGARQ